MPQSAVCDQNARHAEKEALSDAAVRGQIREDNFNGEQKKNRHNGAEQRNIAVGDGLCGKLGKQQSRDQLRRLQLSDLPFSHHPHGGNQHKIDENCADVDRYQENHPDGSVSDGALFYVFCLALKSALARQYKVSPSIFAV